MHPTEKTKKRIGTRKYVYRIMQIIFIENFIPFLILSQILFKRMPFYLLVYAMYVAKLWIGRHIFRFSNFIEMREQKEFIIDPASIFSSTLCLFRRKTKKHRFDNFVLTCQIVKYAKNKKITFPVCNEWRLCFVKGNDVIIVVSSVGRQR